MSVKSEYKNMAIRIEYQCDFCLKKNYEVELIIRADESSIHICNECVFKCVSLVEECREKKAKESEDMVENNVVDYSERA